MASAARADATDTTTDDARAVTRTRTGYERPYSTAFDVAE
jgi:hypothetical protein